MPVLALPVSRYGCRPAGKELNIAVGTMCDLFVKMTSVCRTAWLKITGIGPVRPNLNWFSVLAISLFERSLFPSHQGCICHCRIITVLPLNEQISCVYFIIFFQYCFTEFVTVQSLEIERLTPKLEVYCFFKTEESHLLLRAFRLSARLKEEKQSLHELHRLYPLFTHCVHVFLCDCKQPNEPAVLYSTFCFLSPLLFTTVSPDLPSRWTVC